VDFDYLKPIVADGFGDGDGEYTSAERRAEVLTQFRDKYGRWVEMGRGIKAKVRLGKNRGNDAGRTARVIGKFIGATPDGKFARVLVDPSDPNFAGKVLYIKYNNAEEVLATLDPEYLKKRGIQLGKNTEGYEVGDEGIQDEDTLKIEDPTPQDLKDAEADLPDPENYKEEAAKKTATALTGKDLAAGNIVYDQGSDQYGKITNVKTLADGTKQIFIQFQNGRRAIMNVPADHPIQAWIGKNEAKPTPEAAPAQNKEGSSIADLGIDLQSATMDANGARLPTPGAFTGVLQKILAGAKNWKQIAERLKSQTITYFDFETTGISDYDGQGIKNDPIQLGAVQVKNGKVLKRFNVYINPGSKLSQWSSEHLKRDVIDDNGNIVRDENGKPVSTLVTAEWLQDQMSPEEALRQFLEFVGPNPILGGQNVPFDLEILQRMADAAGVKLDIAGTVDSKDLGSLLPTYDPEKGVDGPKQLNTATGKYRASSSLGPLANFLGFEPANWHSADGDAEDSFNLVNAILDHAIKNDNNDMRLMNFPEMQKLYQERMAAFKNAISGNNPVTEKQLEALHGLAESDNQEIAAEAKKAIDEATTRGKAAEVLARLNTNKDRTNNTPNQFRIGGGGGGELGEGNGVPNKKELEFLAKLKSGGYFLKKKFTKKPKQYIPVGYDRIDSWERYPSWYKDMYESAGNLDDFVKLFWKALRESRKGTRLEDPEGRTDINEKEYAIAAATYKNLQGIGEKVILRYGEFTIEFDKQSDINGQLLDELKGYLDTARKLGFKLPVRIKIAKQGDPAFTPGEVIGFDKDHPELGCLTGEAHTEPDGTMHLILWDQLHNLDKADKRRLFKGINEQGQEEYYGQNPGGFVPALQHVFFHELGHLWNREKHGKMVNSPLWGDLKKMFWGTDAKPFKRFAVTPNADLDPKINPNAFDERMAELFAAALIAFHNREHPVLANIGQFWKVAIEPYIKGEPIHWTANSERVNPPKKEGKGKGKIPTTTPRGGKARTPDVKKPEDVKPGDIVYDKDGNLHGKVVVIRQDRHGNWHYWVEGKDYKPGDVFPVGLDEYVVHKNGIIYVTKAGANFVPDEGPDFIYPLPEKLDSSNSDGVKAEDLKPGMVYESPDGPANVVNVFEHGIGVPDVKKSSDRVVVYVGKDGEVKHEVVPVGTFKKVLTSSKSNVPAPTPENENQGGEGNGNGNGNDRGGEGNGGGRGGRGGNAPEPVSEEPESRSGASKSDIENLKAVLEQAIGIGKRFGPDEDLEQRAQMISDEADELVKEIIKLDIKDYPGLIKHLKDNLPVISEGMYSDKTKQVLDEVKEFLDPGYRKRQYDALDRIKELLKERIEAVDTRGEKTDVVRGLIDDILRPYLNDKAGLNYEELLDLLDKNLKPGEIKHVQKREGISFRGNWDEVVKAVQDIIDANLGKKESAKPTKQKEYLDANGKPIKVGDLVDVIDEYGQKKTIRIYKKTTYGTEYVGGKRRHPTEYSEGYVIEGGDIVNVVTGKRYRINDSVLSPKNGSAEDKKFREKVRDEILDSVLSKMFSDFFKKHRKENPNMDKEDVRKLAKKDVATAVEEFKKLGIYDYDIFNGELNDFTSHMFWTKAEDGSYTGVREYNNVEDAVAAAKEYIDQKNARPTEEKEKESTKSPEPEVTREDPIGKGKIDPKGYAEKGYVPMVHPKPEFPAETDEKKLIEKGFEIEEQDNRDKPSQNREEDSEEGEEGALPPEDTSKFAAGKKVVILWHNKDFSAPGARIKITFTRKADGSLDKRFTQIQWKHWDGTLSGDEYGPSEVLNIGDSESEIFRMEFKHTVGALARRNEEYNDGELPGTVPHYFKKVGDDYIWRAVKDPKTGKWKAARDQKIDLEKKPPFGAVISNKDGKWTATILDPKGNVVATFEVDGDENDKSALENLINQSYVELAKRYRSINAPAAAPTQTARPAGRATDEHNFPLPDDVKIWRIRDDSMTRYAIGFEEGVDELGEHYIRMPKDSRFAATLSYIEGQGHWYVKLHDVNRFSDDERGIKIIPLPETYKTIKGDINDPKAWEEALKEARKFISDAIARNGGKNVRYGYEHRPIESLDDVRVNDYIIFRTSYPPSINYADTDHPEENISGIIGKVLSIGKDKDGNRVFKIQKRDGKIKNIKDKDLDYVGGAVRFSDDDPNINVSTTEIVKKRLAKRQMRELRFSIGMDIEEDPNNSEDSLERIYKAIEDKIGPDLIENHKFIPGLSKALSKKMYDKSNTKGYLTEEEIYDITDNFIKNYSDENKSKATPVQPTENQQPATEETTPTTESKEITGEHNFPLPDDVQMFPAGVGEPYAKYVINGEGFQHEADYPDVRVKDGLRYGVEIYYEEAIEPNSYNKKGRVAGWRVSLLNNKWREDMSRSRLIDYRISEIPGNINDPEAWKKAVEEARKMLANAIAENGGNNNPYTSEYIPLESLDQIQSGDYLMYGGHFPPNTRWKGTKSEETSPNFYAQVVSVKTDENGNRIFEIKEPNRAQGGYYDNVFVNDEEFLDKFGGITGLARYSDENSNVKPAAEPVAETKVEEEPKELTEEERQANIDAWTEVGQLYRKYLAAKRGKNMKREAKRLKQELSPYPAVMLHEKLSDYKDILNNTRNSSTDENEKKAIAKRIAELVDAMKQLNILVNKGVKEGAGKPTDPLDFNFDNLFRDIEVEDGISESDVEEAAEEPEVVEEPAAEPTEEPKKNVIETAGGVLDFEGLSPMQLGKIKAHLDKKVRWNGEVMTYRELYTKFAIGRHKSQNLKDVNYVKGESVKSWGPIKYFLFVDENGGMIDVPKMIYDAFKPNSDDPKLDSDATAPVQEAKMAERQKKWDEEDKAKAEAEAAKPIEEKPEEPVEAEPEKPAAVPITPVETPKDLGPTQITKDTGKQYLAEKIDVGWTLYGPDGYALGVVVKKDTLGRVVQLTVRGPNGKESTYNFNMLTKLYAFSPKDKKDIEKANKTKPATEPEAKEKSEEQPKSEPEVEEQPGEELPDKISREDGYRLFEALKKVYDFIHRSKKTEDPDAAKKDANDKVNQLAKILNPEDVDDFIRYVDLETAFRKIMSSRDFLDNFEEYINNYSSGNGAEVNPIHRGADGKIINKGDDLVVVDKDGNLKKIRLQIFKKPNPRALSDKTDFIEWGYQLRLDGNKNPEIVNINDSKESYSLDNVFHTQDESEIRKIISNRDKVSPEAPTAPEAVENAAYNGNLEDDLSAFKNVLENAIENFRNQPGADKNVYKAAAKELYNELKKLNSLYEDSATSGNDLEQIRNVYDDKIRDLGDIQSAKEKSNPNQNRENFVKDLRGLQEGLIDDFEAERDLGIMGSYSPYNVLSYSDEDKAILLKKATAARLLQYMPDVSFEGLFDSVVANYTRKIFPFGGCEAAIHVKSTVYTNNAPYIGGEGLAYKFDGTEVKNSADMVRLLDTDMSNLVEGSRIIGSYIRFSSELPEVVVTTITKELLDRVKNVKGSNSSSNILDFMKNEMNFKVYSSSSNQDMDDLKEILIAHLIRSWAITSNDSGYKSHALQRLAARMFAMDSSKTAGWLYAAGHDQIDIDSHILKGNIPADINTVDKLEQYASDLVDEEISRHFDIYSKFIMGMYNSTQDLLKDIGIDGVVVYRGSQDQELIAPDGTPIKRNTRVNNLMSARAKQRPMSSWSTSIRTASQFAGGLSPIIMGKIVPAEKVIAMPGTGFGCFEENEVVLLGGDLDEVLYGVPGNIDLNAFKNSSAMNPPKQIQALDPSTGLAGILPPKPTFPTSQNRERDLPIVEVDNSEENSDWIKQSGWDLTTNVDDFLKMFTSRDQLSDFMTKPTAQGMPEEMLRNLWPAADKHFEKIESAPKEEESKYLPEPFDPRDKKADLDEYYNYDYTKMPDGTPFNSDQQQQMDAIAKRLENILKNNDEDANSFAVKNLKNFRRTLYQQIIAKPTKGSSTTRDSILKQVEFSDKPAVKYFDEARGLTYTRYVDKFTDKYGRKYYIVTNIDESSGRQTVVAYDQKNFEGMPLPEDYVRKDQPVSGINDVGGLDSYIFRDPSVSEIQSVMVTDRYQRRGIATALVAVLEKRLGLPVVHSDNLSSMGFAFSNSMDPGKPDLHTNEKSIELQSDNAPSQNREGFFKRNKAKKEPFDPTDPTIDLEKFYNYDYTQMPDGTPFNIYQQQQMDILKDAIDNEPDDFERKLRIAERRRIYQGYTAKPNLKSGTNLESIKDQVRLLDDNTSRMNYSGAGKPYADLPSEYKQSTQYIDEFTDKYGRQYWVVTKVVNGLGMSNVKLYDKSKNSLQDLQDNSEDRTPVSSLDVFNNKISMVYTSDRYVRRGLATAALHLARERSGKEVQHSEMLTSFGRAFSLSVDPNPDLHRNDESKVTLSNNQPSQNRENQYPPEPFDPNDRTLDLDTIYNYDYTKLPDGTPFNAKQQKAMDHENKILEEAIASGDEAKIRAAKIARRYTYNTFITVANPDSKTTTETIADQITPGKAKPKKFTGFVRYTDNFTDKYGRKYVIFTDIRTDDKGDNSAMVTVHDMKSMFLEKIFVPEGMENVDQFGGKSLHIASLKVNDDDRKDPNAAAYIGMVLTDDAYRRRGLATAMLYLARKHYSKPVNHSSTLTMYGKAFSNSVDAGKPDVHDSLESKQLQIDLLKEKGLPVKESELDGDEIDYGPNQNRENIEEPTILNEYREVIPLNNSYRDKNDPDLDLTQWVTGGTKIYGIGNGGNPLGYVRTEKLATMKGNLADMESSTSSIAHDLEDGTGYLEPVLVWYNPLTGRAFIAEGNHRVEAARIAGREYVPVVVGVSTVDFKNPTTMERSGGVGDVVLNKDGSLENFKNAKDGSLINPYHLFNDEDLLYPRINLDPKDVPGFTDVLKIQSDLLNELMAENEETGLNEIATWYDPDAFDIDSSIGHMGGASEQLKEITAKNIGSNMLSSPKDILGALDHAISISQVVRSRLSYLDSQKMALKALDSKSDNLNENSIILFIDDSEHSPYEGLHIETLREVLDSMDPYDEELYGNPYDEETIDYKTLFDDYYANKNKKPIFFDNPEDIEAFKEKAASILVAQWAETSNGSDMLSHALQIAAAETFKMPAGSWSPWKVQSKNAQYTKDILENAEYYYGIHSSVLKDFLKTMYDLTQDRFKNYGIKYLTLYRGTGVDEEALKIDTGIEYNGIGDVEILQRPMSAWAWLHGDAFNFATSRLQERAGMFMGTIIPVEQVLSIPGTGFGCFEEAEVVLLAGKNRLVRAVTSDFSNPTLDQKTFIAENASKVISYLLDQLPKDKNAFDNLIEFNKGTPNTAGPSQNREIPSINVDDSVENSDWVISEFAKKKKLDAKENELPEGSGQTNPVEEPISLNELHRTFITALLAGAGDQRTRPLPDAKPEWLAADVETDNLTMAEKNAIYTWYMNVVKGDGASSDNLSINAQVYLTKHIIPLINRHAEDDMLLPHHDIYINKDNNVTIKVVRFIINPTKKNGKTNVNTEYRAATAAGVAKFANKLSDVLSRVKFKFPVKELQVIISHPSIEDYFKPFTRDDGTRGRNLAGLSFPHMFVNGQILNEEDVKPNPKLTENPRADATELESTIAHEIGHVLQQKGIINFNDQATKDTLRRFMTEYPLSDYAATDEAEYLAEAYAGMMISEDGIGRHKEVADWINDQIATVDERKEKAAIDLLKGMLEKLGIPNNSKPSQNREGSREQIIASAAKDIASSGIGFTPGKIKNDISIAIDGPVVQIEGFPKKDAVAPSDQATAIKNEIIGLGHMILDDARTISDEQARAEGLIPEGFDAEEYRKKLENDARALELEISKGDSKFRAMAQDLMRNAFNRLSYEDKEEVFQSLKQEAAKELSGKDVNVFSAEETFNMLLVEYGDDLSHKLAYDYATPHSEFIFDTGKTVLQRVRSKKTLRLTKDVEEVRALIDVTGAHEGGETILSLLTKWAIRTGKIDTSDLAKKAAEIKEVRDRLRASPKAEDFTNKYHSIIGKNIKSQMEKSGVEFDSIPAHQFFNQYKDYKYVNSNEKFQDIRIDRNKKLIKNLEETLSFVPKDIILAGMEYLAHTGGKLGVQISDARAQFKQHWKNKNLINSLRWKKEQGDGGFFRGDSTDDYLHEVWHFFQMINHDIAALEHAFSYDRIKTADSSNIIPSMEVYENWMEESFSGAKVADPYTVKVYPRATSKFATFSPNNHSAEVITTTMQDLFTDPGRFSTPNGVTVKTGKGKKTTRFSDARMDIATGVWYTDATMTTKIDPKLITGIEGLDPSNDTDWDLKAFGIGLLMSLLNWENK